MMRVEDDDKGGWQVDMMRRIDTRLVRLTK